MKIQEEKTECNSISPFSFVLYLFAIGPFTVFVPVDQAFEILIQKFGGMEKATEEFNKNPDVLESVSLPSPSTNGITLSTSSNTDVFAKAA